MRRTTSGFLLLTSFVALPGCDSEGGDISGPELTASESLILVINEIMPGNDGAIADDHGEFDDWFEVFNTTAASVDVGGMYVTDDTDLSIGEWWRIPDTDPSVTTILPGGHLVLWADGQPDQGPLHVDFKLGASGESIGLVDTDGETIINIFAYPAMAAEVSYGRIPDGSDLWQTFETATPGGDNSFTPPTLVINEFLADNDSTSHADEAGETEDWIEIFNTGTEAIDLGGMYLTDDLTNPTKTQIPSTDPGATTVQPGEHLILWADNDPEQGILHLGWKLSGDGEEIGLVVQNGSGLVIVDAVTFEAQVEGVSQGRSPDGGDVWAFFDQPTPGATNG